MWFNHFVISVGFFDTLVSMQVHKHIYTKQSTNSGSKSQIDTIAVRRTKFDWVHIFTVSEWVSEFFNVPAGCPQRNSMVKSAESQEKLMFPLLFCSHVIILLRFQEGNISEVMVQWNMDYLVQVPQPVWLYGLEEGEGDGSAQAGQVCVCVQPHFLAHTPTACTNGTHAHTLAHCLHKWGCARVRSPVGSGGPTAHGLVVGRGQGVEDPWSSKHLMAEVKNLPFKICLGTTEWKQKGW